jgi:hypothetical protein
VYIYLRSGVDEEIGTGLDEGMEIGEPGTDEADCTEFVCGAEEEAGVESDDIGTGLDVVNSDLELDTGSELDSVSELASVVPVSTTDDDSVREVETVEVDENGNSPELADDDWLTTSELSSSEDDEVGNAGWLVVCEDSSDET